MATSSETCLPSRVRSTSFMGDTLAPSSLGSLFLDCAAPPRRLSPRAKRGDPALGLSTPRSFGTELQDEAVGRRRRAGPDHKLQTTFFKWWVGRLADRRGARRRSPRARLVVGRHVDKGWEELPTCCATSSACTASRRSTGRRSARPASTRSTASPTSLPIASPTSQRGDPAAGAGPSFGTQRCREAYPHGGAPHPRRGGRVYGAARLVFLRSPRALGRLPAERLAREFRIRKQDAECGSGS